MSIINGLTRWGTAAIAAAAILMGTVLAADDKAKEGDQAFVAKPFNGKDLEGWKAKGKDFGAWVVGTAKLDPNDPKSTRLFVSKGGDCLVNALTPALAHGFDLYSTAKYGDQILKLDVMVPKGSNSGIYLQGEYVREWYSSGAGREDAANLDTDDAQANVVNFQVGWKF